MSWQLLELWKSVPNYVSPYKTSYFAQFVADTQADLPARVQSDYIIELGSKCHVVADNSDWEIKSDGTWVESQMGTDVYSKAQIDAMLLTKQDVLTFDSVPVENSTNPVYSGGVFDPIQKAIAELVVDKAGKNRLQNNGNSTTVSGEVTFTVNSNGSIDAEVIATTTAARNLSWYVTIPAGSWIFTTNQPLSGASPAPCYAYLYTNTTIALDYGERRYFTINEDTYLRCFVQLRKDVPAGETFTFQPMVCLPIEYQISNKFIPYAST